MPKRNLGHTMATLANGSQGAQRSTLFIPPPAHGLDPRTDDKKGTHPPPSPGSARRERGTQWGELEGAAHMGPSWPSVAAPPYKDAGNR